MTDWLRVKPKSPAKVLAEAAKCLHLLATKLHVRPIIAAMTNFGYRCNDRSAPGLSPSVRVPFTEIDSKETLLLAIDSKIGEVKAKAAEAKAKAGSKQFPDLTPYQIVALKKLRVDIDALSDIDGPSLDQMADQLKGLASEFKEVFVSSDGHLRLLLPPTRLIANTKLAVHTYRLPKSDDKDRVKYLKVATPELVLTGLELHLHAYDNKYASLRCSYRRGSPVKSHPHLSGNSLCLGDSQMAIYSMLKWGQFYDAMHMVKQLLGVWAVRQAYGNYGEMVSAKMQKTGHTLIEKARKEAKPGKAIKPITANDIYAKIPGTDQWFASKKSRRAKVKSK